MPIIRGILEVWGFADGILREAVIIFGLWCCLVLKLFLPGIGAVFFFVLALFFNVWPLSFEYHSQLGEAHLEYDLPRLV